MTNEKDNYAYWKDDHSCSCCGQSLEAPPYEGTQLWYHTPYCPFCGHEMNKEYKDNCAKWRVVGYSKISKTVECTHCKERFWFLKKGQLNIDKMDFCPKCGFHITGVIE